MAARPFIQRRHLPSCGPLSSRKSSRVEISKRFTTQELEDALKRNKAKDIAAMAADRKRNAIAAQNQRANQRGDSSVVDSSTQLRSLDVGVKLCARKYNEAKAQASKLEDEVKSRRDELAELERESRTLHEMLQGNNADARKITHLTSKIQDVNDCSENILAYRQQLNHMHQRLGKNSVSLDGHISEMSTALAAAQKEKDRSQNMLAELESCLTFASIELDDTIQDTRIVDDERNRELAMKRGEASNASRMEEWNTLRVSSNLAAHASLADAGRSERDRLQRMIREKHTQMKELNRSMSDTIAKLSRFEESFTHVKQATGVNSLTEMVNKFNSHDENHLQLMKEKKDAEARLRSAKSSLFKDQETLAQLKTNGLCTTELNREILDDIKSSIASEKTDGKIVKSTNKRLEDLLVGLRQGGIGLYNRLLPFHSTLLNGEAPKLGEMDSTNAIQAASDTMEMINFTESILGKMLMDIGGIQNVRSASAGGGSKSPGSPGPESPSERMNCRVTPKKSDVEEGGEKENDDSTESEEILSRNQLKSESYKQVAQRRVEDKPSQKKRTTPKKKPKTSTSCSPHPVQHHQPPTTPKVKNLMNTGPRSHTKTQAVSAFLTEMPDLS